MKKYVEYGVTQRVIRCWGELIYEAQSQGRVLATADAWIASTAVVLDVPLVTHNARDFEYLDRLELITAPNH